MKTLKIILTDYIGFKKEIKLSNNQVKELNAMPKEEFNTRLKNIARHYSKNYWINIVIDGKSIIKMQWQEI